jgi:predicted O-methyltransferase YrrM
MIIQPDYWTGSECVKNEVPWQTPDSIRLLDRICLLNHKVLEIGTGGSTLFYARRCQCVTAIETNREWYQIIQKVLKERSITNVDYFYIDNQEEIEDTLKSLKKNFDIISVDSVHGYDRSAFLRTLLKTQHMVSTLVLDNYADKTLFPEHHDKSIEELNRLCGRGWKGFDFDDPKWTGNGTRILHRT